MYHSRAEKVADAEQLKFLHVLATAGIKRDGYEIVPSGWITEDFDRNNGAVFWRHFAFDPEDLMGNGRAWKSKAAVAGQDLGLHLRGETTMLPGGVNPKSDMAGKMYAGGHLTGVSVRWDDDGPDSMEDIPREELEKVPGISAGALYWGGVRFKRARLIEYSLVPMGMDQQAVTIRNLLRSASPEVRAMFEAQKDAPGPDGREVMALDGRPLREIDPRRTVDLGATRNGGEADADDDDPDDAGDDSTGDDVPPADDPPAGDPPTEGAPAGEPPVNNEPPADASSRSVDNSRAAIPFSIHGKVPKADKGMAWDGAAARRALAKWASSDGTGAKDKMNWPKYRRGFLWYNTESPENFGSYSYPHHHVINGRFVSVWRGVVAAAQRLQQGNVGSSEMGAMRRHLEQEYGQFDETPPWKQQAGRHYEQLHAMLRTASAEAAAPLRDAIVRLAVEVYGEDRLPEAWEPRELPAGGRQAWEAVRSVLISAIGEVVEDAEDAEARADQIVHRLAEPLLPIVAERTEQDAFRSRLAEATGIDLAEPGWEDAVVRHIGDLRADAETAVRAETTSAQPRAEDYSTLAAAAEGFGVAAKALRAEKPRRGAGKPLDTGGTLLDRIGGEPGA